MVSFSYCKSHIISLCVAKYVEQVFLIINFFFIILRTCSVNLEFPKIEVRFQELKVDAYVHVGSRALPTIPNFIFNMTEVSTFHIFLVPLFFQEMKACFWI